MTATESSNDDQITYEGVVADLGTPPQLTVPEWVDPCYLELDTPLVVPTVADIEGDIDAGTVKLRRPGKLVAQLQKDIAAKKAEQAAAPPQEEEEPDELPDDLIADCDHEFYLGRCIGCGGPRPDDDGDDD